MVEHNPDIPKMYEAPIHHLHMNAYYRGGALNAVNFMLPNHKGSYIEAVKHQMLVREAQLLARMLRPIQSDPMDDATAAQRATLSLFGALAGLLVSDKVHGDVVPAEVGLPMGRDAHLSTRVQDVGNFARVQPHVALMGMRGLQLIGSSARKVELWDHEESSRTIEPALVTGALSCGFGAAIYAVHTARVQIDAAIRNAQD